MTTALEVWMATATSPCALPVVEAADPGGRR